ncbi:deoxyguanosinetriphosphate triphosphohydrolase [Iocasia frigidifontis]|uniref:Deoxyguanosinetriphosphate triphosphohydrolase-like protein n=1 Tax=Iocasia fonsfrigidae TaxID=2682810 RepID=A0A8A7K864_9FIRM|nr:MULTISPECIES: deoxyguanosinetriphosphate triphosphohydrolase [Halanaerobiaceae]AZO95028.1 deoxyguanosinetriphosphate triphosphohydrolase [Halocella sp. SP3-1]MTI61302.1 deoxyguanosinetriphosphate triphosphohydrolase [Bacillota bacterium]QTL97983.1 deoxyguanosinetriphosphate triphosphohydrolase [Iocasia fonsfrigidae]
MLKRVDIEKREAEILSPYAFLSKNSQGRLKEEPECDIRTVFQRDRDRIIHSKAFRRLKHKTQVFIVPEGDHYRTRLTHTFEVAQIARTIARSLGLNEDLTEAMALGHDLGHTPFGHAGESALNDISNLGFKHNEHSLRVVDYIESLNLSFEVRDGILKHTGDEIPLTLEGEVVRIADRIAYINHDIDDALRAGVISREDLPLKEINLLGETHSERIDTMVRDMINSSWEQKVIKRSPAIKDATEKLRSFLFQKVYIGSAAKKEEEKAKRLVQHLYEYYLCHIDEIPEHFKSKEKGIRISNEQLVVDYIAGMSDQYAMNRWKELFLPFPWIDKK